MESIHYIKSPETTQINEILLKACAVAKIGWWEVSMPSGVPVWSDVTKQIHEVPLDYVPTMEGALAFYKEGESRDSILRCVNDAILYGKPYELDVQIITAPQKTKWVKTIGFTEFENGKCSRFYGTFQDINEAKTQELKLKQSEEAFRKSFENAAIGKAIVNLDGKWLRVNKSLCTVLGYDDKELLELTFQDITHPEDLNTDLHLLHEMLSGGRENYQLEKRYLHKEGFIVYTLLSVSLVKDGNGNPDFFIAQVIDISERKKAVKQLRYTLTTLKSILEASTHVAIIATDKDGFITSFNRGAENMLGYTAEELIEKKSPYIFHNYDEIRERAKELSAELGKEVACDEVFTVKARYNESYTNEWTYKNKNGKTFPVQLVMTAIKNDDDIITGFLGIAADISHLKNTQNELKSLLNVLSDQNNRLKNFAHIVSHNLRSHSSNLSMLIDLIYSEQDGEMKDEMFVMLAQAADKLKETINHLNEVVIVNTTTSETLKTVMLNESLHNAVANINGLLINVGGKINVNVPNDLSIDAVPAYIDSIFNNLLTNSIKYHSPDRPLSINISATRQEKNLVLSIEDNGKGIDLKKNGHKIFGMYKTFHNNSDARGIGLFITKNQIESMGGKIEVFSEVDRGTCFKIYFNEKV